MLHYSFHEQIKDIFPSFILASSMGIIVYFIGYLLDVHILYKLIFQIIAGAIFVIAVSEFLKFKDYLNLKGIALEKLNQIKNNL